MNLQTNSKQTNDAYRHCAEITRASGSSFAAAFWMLSREQRKGLYAIYAFCRLADDIADDESIAGDRGRLLERWRGELEDAYSGKATHPVGIALADTVSRFELPKRLFLDLLRGIEMDLTAEPLENFEDVERYCYFVASTVGLAIVGVRGVRGDRIERYAANMGIAVQLTNILRDVGTDAGVGRIYLARKDRERHGVTPEMLEAGPMTEELRLLLAGDAERARIRFERAREAMPMEFERALLPAEAMGAIYRELLEELQSEGFPCLERVVRLPKAKRIAIAAGVWMRRPSAAAW